jgi:copper homeostasis protein
VTTVTVELTVDSVGGARAAEAGGADRIELCQSLGDGGLTPSLGLFEAVRDAVGIPVVAMIRPRGGDFLYDDDEFAVMCRDVQRLAGASGFATGVLTANGTIDVPRMRELVELAGPLPVTCHRAFDLTADALLAVDALCELGIARLLTSGQAARAPDGAAVIRLVAERAANRLAVIAGSGVRADNVVELVRATGVREVHLSATAWRDSAMTFRRAGVPMGTAGTDEYRLRQTDPALVTAVIEALRAVRMRP